MKQISKPTLIDVLLLGLIAVVWGSAFSSIKVVVAETGALWAAGLRVGLGFLVVLPFLIFATKLKRVSLRSAKLILIVALLNMVIPFILISWSLKHIDAGVGALLLGTTPFIAMFIGHFTTQDERITSRRALSVLFAIGGILVLVGPQAVSGLGSSAVLAQIAVVISGGCYVSAGFAMRRLDMDPITFTTLALGTGAVILCSIAFFFAGPPEFSLSNEALFNLIWLGTVPTGVAYLLRYWLVQKLGVSTFALAMNTVPIFGIMIGALYLGETVEWSTLIALALVLCGLAIARSATPSKSDK